MIDYPLKCERCGGDFSSGDARIDDFLLDEYPGRAICWKCDGQIVHAYEASIRGLSPVEYAKVILKVYGVEIEEESSK